MNIYFKVMIYLMVTLIPTHAQELAEKEPAQTAQTVQNRITLPQPSKCDGHYAKRMEQIKAQNANTKTVENLIIGDSITEVFPIKLTPKKWNLHTRGISGDCVGGWKYRGLLDRLDASCHQLKPKRVFILIGINDTINYSKDYKWDKSYVSASQDELIKGYTKIIKEIQTHNPKTEIYICSVLPLGQKRGFDKYNATVNELNAKVKAVTEKTKTNYLDLHSVFLEKGKTHMQPALSSDGIHLTKAGYQVWIEQLRKVIEGDS